MKFKTVIDTKPLCFQRLLIGANPSSSYYIITSVPVEANQQLIAEHCPQGKKIDTFFQIGQLAIGDVPVSEGGFKVGYLFYTEYTSLCYGTSIFSFSNVHKERAVTGTPINSQLVLKSDLFYTYHAPNVGTLISNPKAATKLHDALTTL